MMAIMISGGITLRLSGLVNPRIYYTFFFAWGFPYWSQPGDSFTVTLKTKKVMKRFIGFVIKEFYHIFRDYRTLLILFGIPAATAATVRICPHE